MHIEKRETLEKEWASRAAKLLVGKVVKSVRYLSTQELADLGWDQSTLVIIFTDDTAIYASCDDEGNEPGALFTNSEELPTIPVI